MLFLYKLSSNFGTGSEILRDQKSLIQVSNVHIHKQLINIECTGLLPLQFPGFGVGQNIDKPFNAIDCILFRDIGSFLNRIIL